MHGGAVPAHCCAARGAQSLVRRGSRCAIELSAVPVVTRCRSKQVGKVPCENTAPKMAHHTGQSRPKWFDGHTIERVATIPSRAQRITVENKPTRLIGDEQGQAAPRKAREGRCHPGACLCSRHERYRRGRVGRVNPIGDRLRVDLLA
jgi:hypothetical protein